MAQKKKLTRQDKIKCTEKGICWKCKKELERDDNRKLICKDCGLSF